jgi:hypothetical protein
MLWIKLKPIDSAELLREIEKYEKRRSEMPERQFLENGELLLCHFWPRFSLCSVISHEITEILLKLINHITFKESAIY